MKHVQVVPIYENSSLMLIRVYVSIQVSLLAWQAWQDIFWREPLLHTSHTILLCRSLCTQLRQWPKALGEEAQLLGFACIVITISVAGIPTVTLPIAQCGRGSRSNRKGGTSSLPKTKPISCLGETCKSSMNGCVVLIAF